MQVQNALDDGEAEPGRGVRLRACCAGVVEAIENSLKIFVRYAAARVRHRHANRTGARVQIDGHFTTSGRELQCITQQVFQHSLHQADIGLHHGGLLAGLDLQSYAGPLGFQLEILADVMQ